MPPTNMLPPSITVKVQQPLPPEEPHSLEELLTAPPQPSGGEEQIPLGLLPQNGTILVPVTPEAPVAPSPSGKTVRIAIVIDDLGPELKSGERAIALPSAITLSYLPFAVRAREQAKEARDNGHEILLHLPMEPLGHEHPGRGALMVDLPMSELRARLETALSSLTGYDGVNNHMGSKFTTYKEGMELVIDDLMERRLFFLDSRTNTQTVAIKVARQKGLPSLSRDVFLDDDPSPEAIRKQLEATERVAHRNGFAVAIGHPHTTTMDVLEAWAAEAPSRGIELVPLNKLVEWKP
ncbi:MAG: divergent polysaccharide deacetylase family protein [Bdellovibrionales bacterium]